MISYCFCKILTLSFSFCILSQNLSGFKISFLGYAECSSESWLLLHRVLSTDQLCFISTDQLCFIKLTSLHFESALNSDHFKKFKNSNWLKECWRILSHFFSRISANPSSFMHLACYFWIFLIIDLNGYKCTLHSQYKCWSFC